LAQRGYEVFMTEACDVCHTPPLYTNNMLLPVAGFKVSDRLQSVGSSNSNPPERKDILNIPINTDANLALNTRRGTGYYKVPSLKGVWYRGPFEHNGSVATLEDLFDPERLRDDYVPTGFRGYGVTTRAVKGHEFGLNLTDEERTALIAFLKTL
jgi:RoxA-like, cytochrome c-like